MNLLFEIIKFYLMDLAIDEGTDFVTDLWNKVYRWWTGESGEDGAEAELVVTSIQDQVIATTLVRSPHGRAFARALLRQRVLPTSTYVKTALFDQMMEDGTAPFVPKAFLDKTFADSDRTKYSNDRLKHMLRSITYTYLEARKLLPKMDKQLAYADGSLDAALQIIESDVESTGVAPFRTGSPDVSQVAESAASQVSLAATRIKMQFERVGLQPPRGFEKKLIALAIALCREGSQ